MSHTDIQIHKCVLHYFWFIGRIILFVLTLYVSHVDDCRSIFPPHCTSTYPRSRRKHINNGGYHCSLYLARAREVVTISFTFVMSQVFTLSANICILVELILWNSEANVFKLSFLTRFFPLCFIPFVPSCPSLLCRLQRDFSGAVSRLSFTFNIFLRSQVNLYDVRSVQSATVTSFSSRSALFAVNVNSPICLIFISGQRL
jgi:hypothetical protein